MELKETEITEKESEPMQNYVQHIKQKTGSGNMQVERKF